MTAMPLFEMKIIDLFRFADGRTVFVGPIKGDVKFVRPCRCELLVNGVPTCAIQIEGEMIPDRTSPEGYRISKMVEGIDARRVRQLGGTGGKIMVYLRMDVPEANTQNLATLKHFIEDFGREDLLLVVEFLTYQLDG